MEKKKEFYLIVKGEKVKVNEEVYREYVRPLRREQRQKRRSWRCLVVGRKWKNGKVQIVRCQEDCSACPYSVNGKPNGSTLSLDRFKEEGYEIEDKELDLEEDYIEEETRHEREEKLHKAISRLNPRQQEMVQLVYFEGLTQEEVAVRFGIDSSSVRHSMMRIKATLKKFLREK